MCARGLSPRSCLITNVAWRLRTDPERGAAAWRSAPLRDATPGWGMRLVVEPAHCSLAGNARRKHGRRFIVPAFSISPSSAHGVRRSSSACDSPQRRDGERLLLNRVSVGHEGRGESPDGYDQRQIRPKALAHLALRAAQSTGSARHVSRTCRLSGSFWILHRR